MGNSEKDAHDEYVNTLDEFEKEIGGVRESELFSRLDDTVSSYIAKPKKVLFMTGLR